MLGEVCLAAGRLEIGVDLEVKDGRDVIIAGADVELLEYVHVDQMSVCAVSAEMIVVHVLSGVH